MSKAGELLYRYASLSASGGMKQRLGIAQALLGEPRVLVIDEPTAGLDPAERIKFRNLLAELSGQHIIILSTQDGIITGDGSSILETRVFTGIDPKATSISFMYFLEVRATQPGTVEFAFQNLPIEQ